MKNNKNHQTNGRWAIDGIEMNKNEYIAITVSFQP